MRAIHSAVVDVARFGDDPQTSPHVKKLEPLPPRKATGPARAVVPDADPGVAAARETSAIFRMADAPGGRSFEMTCRPAPHLRAGDGRPVALTRGSSTAYPDRAFFPSDRLRTT